MRRGYLATSTTCICNVVNEIKTLHVYYEGCKFKLVVKMTDLIDTSIEQDNKMEQHVCY